MSVRAEVLMGWLKVLVSLLWAGLSLAGMAAGQRMAAWGTDTLTSVLTPVQENMALVRETLVETGAALSAAEEALAAAQQLSLTASQALGQSSSSIEAVHHLVAEEAPATLRQVNAAMPAVIEAAAAVDQTLVFLSGLNLVLPNPFGDDWRIGLGVEYAPAVPLDAALQEVGASLEGLPEQMEALGSDLEAGAQNLAQLSGQMDEIAGELDTTRQQVSRLRDQVEGLSAGLVGVESVLGETYQWAQDRLPVLARAWVGLMSLILLSQVPSLYLGAQMIRGETIRRRVA